MMSYRDIQNVPLQKIKEDFNRLVELREAIIRRKWQFDENHKYEELRAQIKRSRKKHTFSEGEEKDINQAARSALAYEINRIKVQAFNEAVHVLNHPFVDDPNNTPLMAAAAAGRLDILQFWYSKGASLTDGAPLNTLFKITPLFLAAKHGHTNCVNYILSKISSSGFHPSDREKHVKSLVEKGPKTESKYIDPLSEAIRNDHLEAAKTLIKTEVFKLKDPRYMDAAIASGKKGMVVLLAAHGLEITIQHLETAVKNPNLTFEIVDDFLNKLNPSFEDMIKIISIAETTNKDVINRLMNKLFDCYYKKLEDSKKWAVFFSTTLYKIAAEALQKEWNGSNFSLDKIEDVKKKYPVSERSNFGKLISGMRRLHNLRSNPVEIRPKPR